MACEHKRVKCVNCVFICMDCGAKLDPPAIALPEKAEPPKKRATRKGAAKG